MDMTGGNLVLQTAVGQESDGNLRQSSSPDGKAGSAFSNAMDDAAYRSSEATTYKFAAVTLLVVAFLGVLLAIAALTGSPDGETAVVQPVPKAAPTAVFEVGDQRLYD